MSEDLTNYPNGLSSFGMPVVPGGYIPAGGKHYWVNPATGSDGNEGKSPAKALATVGAAYDKCTSGNNDVVHLIGNATTMTNLSEALTWAKHYTHLVGECAPTMVGQRARMFQLSTATGLSPLMNITATGCVFRNFYIFQGVDDATSLINVQVTGQRNYFENVHFAGGGHATMAIDDCASLFINGGAENTFVNCLIGVNTIAMATGGNALRFDGSATRNVFINCMLDLLIGNAGARLVELVDSASLDRWTRFVNTMFNSNSVNKATTMASAFEIPAGHTITAEILLENCRGKGFTDWDDDNRGLLWLNTGTITAGGNSGIMQASNST